MTTPIIDLIPFAKTIGVEIVEASRDKVVGKLVVWPTFARGAEPFMAAQQWRSQTRLAQSAVSSLCPKARREPRPSKARPTFSAAKQGTVVIGEAMPLHRGKRTSVWQTKIYADDGKAGALVIQTQMTLAKTQAVI
jgi:hypothetical protein